MQNLSNFSNPGVPSWATGSSVQYMQNYIRELTAYINENNQKYHKNMVTLKEFYQQQMQEMQDQRDQLRAENSSQINEIQMLKDMVGTSKLRLKQLEELLEAASKREEINQRKAEAQQNRKDELQRKIEEKRQEWERQMKENKQILKEMQQQNQSLKGEIRQKDRQIEGLLETEKVLETKVNENYLLPGKIMQIKEEQAQKRLKFEELSRKLAEIKDQFNSSRVQLERYQAENESLRIDKANFTMAKKLEVEKAVNEQKALSEERIKKLETEKQSLIYQLNEAEGKILGMSKEVTTYQREVQKQRDEKLNVERELKSANSEKEDYLSEFSSLKGEYQAVIKRLQDTLISYQKKNWDLEQQNKDLSGQLQSLKQLLQEVKSINSLTINRNEYRRLAQLEILAGQKTNSREQADNDLEKGESKEKDEMSSEWEKLMNEIEQMKV